MNPDPHTQAVLRAFKYEDIVENIKRLHQGAPE
jgi:hypothetical protein